MITAPNERGFTLIELLVVMAILSILVFLSLEAYSTYRQGAFVDAAHASNRDARVALAAGSSDLDELPSGWYGGWRNTPGTVMSWSGDSILPGYVNPTNIEVFVFRNTWCDEAGMDWCLAEGVVTRHCKAGRQIQWLRWRNGIETNLDFSFPPNC